MHAITVTSLPLHAGRVSPLLYGGFIELLDDLVPGMRAEMLNDRKFGGIEPATASYYYTGAPNVCDRPWNASETWRMDADGPFPGIRSVRLSPRIGRDASLSQSGLAVRAGMTYRFQAVLRGDTPWMRVRARLSARAPDGTRIELGSAPLAKPGTTWSAQCVDIASSGTADDAVFELTASVPGRVWAAAPSLMPADNREGWRADVVEAVREARPGIIRWGGCTVDPGGYRWKTGIGARDARTPFRNDPWGRIDPNDVGLDEFLRFCELVDALPLVCVSFADGPDSARDLVAYCNAGPDTEWGGRRAANGHPAPYGVRYWQIGNELGDAEYVRGCAAICRAIRESDPEAVLLSSYPSAELLAEAGAYLDYACPHHYTPDLAQDIESIDRTVEMVRAASLDHEVRIGVTEWNVTGGWWGNDRGKLLTLDAALFTGRYLNLLHRRSDVVGLACRSNMTNSLGSGMIQTDPAGLLLTPGYHVMRLYARSSLPVPVAVSGVPDGVDASACASEDGTRLSVFLVNTTREPVALRLALDGFGAGLGPRRAEAVCDVRDMRQPDLMNHFSAPDRVRTVDLAVEGDAVTLPALSAAVVECAGE
jgi:alpha-L-arabinofuranosidase